MILKCFFVNAILLAMGLHDSSLASAETDSRQETYAQLEIENARRESSGAAPQQPSYAADEKRIRDIYREFEAAFRAGDVDSMLSRIDEQAIYAFGEIEMIGRDALRQVFVENVGGVWKDAEATHTLHGIAFPSSDVAVVWGNYVVDFSDRSQETGHFMNILLRRDGDWIWVAEQGAPRQTDRSNDHER